MRRRERRHECAGASCADPFATGARRSGRARFTAAAAGAFGAVAFAVVFFAADGRAAVVVFFSAVAALSPAAVVFRAEVVLRSTVAVVFFAGVDHGLAKEAMRLASYKLPIRTKFLSREGAEGESSATEGHAAAV